MKVMMFGYYYYADGYFSAGELLRKNYLWSFFPFIDWLNKSRDLNTLIKLLNGKGDCNVINDFPQYNDEFKNEKTDIVLFWHNKPYLNADELNVLKKSTTCQFIQVDWDPCVFNKKWLDELDKRILGLDFFDKIFTCNPKMLNYYKGFGKNRELQHFLPGFNTNISYYLLDKAYSCDVSIVCTNLYDDLEFWSSTKICRKDVVDAIYKDENINFHFYGPEKFKKLYPKAYKGFIKYEDCYKVFSNSKINLNISPVGDSLNDVVDGKQKHYISERCPQILGSKGLMMCDTNLEPILLHNKHYIKIDSITQALEIIYDVIENNNKYNNIRENGFNYANNNMTWDKVLSNLI